MFDYNKAESQRETIPNVGQLVFVKTADSIFNPESKLVVFKNEYGILLQWKVAEEITHNFYSFDLNNFIFNNGDLEK
jgi:hypothetical protein